MSPDPKEYELMLIPNYEQILEMIDRGVIKKIRGKARHKPFKFGFRGGRYLGAPGKDIFLTMPSFTEEQFYDVANRVAGLFPKKPPNNHLHWAACIRYIYGCFEKQGCLRSDQDKHRMIEENPDWDMPMRFMSLVRQRFKKDKNIYGRVLHHEMAGHRFGDKAIIDKDHTNLDSMVQHYEKSRRLALKCKSWKHTWTPLYWAACYYYEVGDRKNAAKYHILNLQNMEKYCPDTRPGYREKAIISMNQLRECISRHEWKKIKTWLSRCKNKCLVKIRGQIK